MIKQKLTTRNKSSGTNTREYIVLHHTATREGSIRGVLNTLTVGKVSCHFVVDTNGDIYQIGELTDILWHAGQSAWQGRRDLNRYSVGIEVIGPLPGFTNAQRKSVRDLVSYLLKELNLATDRIIRHKDIAPGRKTDIDDNFWSNEYPTFTDYQKSFMPQTEIVKESEFLKVYEEEKKRYRLEKKEPYEPIFSDLTGEKPATISDVKYLIEISRMREKMSQ